ncbi:hypothetical protein G7Y79_00057g090760 [Physcia stellaris]|nr:hypothetical protein G7Y79_00057g090760 [Physcia stellaris]
MYSLSVPGAGTRILAVRVAVALNWTDPVGGSPSQTTFYTKSSSVQGAPASGAIVTPPYLSTTSLQAILPGVTIKPASISAIEAPILSITPSPVTLSSPHGLESGVPADCIPFACKIIFQYVGVYYWPPSVQNTACLSTEGAASQIIPSGMQLPDPPDHLVVFTSIHATDGCRKLGNTYVDYTHTYHPGELSSIRDGATYSFNFGDLPCPPESAHWTRPGTYAPMIAFPDWMTEVDPAWTTCDAGNEQGIDPFTAFPSKRRGSGPHEGPPLRKMKRGNHEHGHAHGRKTPRAVTATPTATTIN